MKKPVLLIPVENQVRELDAKLLLACVAAKRDLTSIIGPQTENRKPHRVFSTRYFFVQISEDREAQVFSDLPFAWP